MNESIIQSSENLLTNFSNFYRGLETKSYNNKEQILPSELYNNIANNTKNISFFRKYATQITVGTSSIDIFLEKDKNSIKWSNDILENNDKLKNSSLSKFTIPVFDMQLSQTISNNFLEDCSIDIEKYLNNNISNLSNEEENRVFMIGDGKKTPEGLLTNLEKVKKITIKNNIIASILEAYSTMDNSYLSNSVWIFSREIISLVLSEASKLMSFNLSNEPMNILGLPYYISDHFADKTVGLLVNLQKSYCIVDRKDMTVFKDPYSSKPNIIFDFTKRLGAKRIFDNAMILLTKE